MMDDYPFTLLYDSRSKRLRLALNDEGAIIVKAPRGVAYRVCEEFVRANRPWIDRQRMRRSDARRRIEALVAEGDGRVPYLGEWIACRVDSRQKSRYIYDGTLLTLRHPDHLRSFYRDAAREYFAGKSSDLAVLMGVVPQKIVIREQSSRWGSCSARRTISLNAHLIKAPQFVSEYVLVHELAHLRHMDHSSEFWDVVALFAPYHREARQWLKEFQPIIMADLSKTLSTVTCGVDIPLK